MLSGRCLCGSLRYQVDDAVRSMLHCHCSMCRKAHGASFATFVAARADRLEWTSDASRGVFESSTGSLRFFCTRCGSKGPNIVREDAFVPAGNLEGDIGARPTMHIFAASKAPWYDITDGLTCYPEYPPGHDGVPEQPARASPSEDAIGGSCLCGDVRFEYVGAPLFMMNCHCSRCRLGRSAAHATNLFLAPQQFRWLSGRERVVIYDLPGAQRFGINFCSTCGSGVPRESRQIGRMVIPAGGLDADPGVKPVGHIFTRYKAAWFDITDGAPQHPERAT